MPEVGQLAVEHTREGACHTLALVGELDLVTVAQLRAALASARAGGAAEVVLDLRRVGFMDSSGLRTVLTAWEDCRAEGRAFFLIPDRGACRRVLEITGVLDELPLREAPEDRADSLL